LEAQTFITLAVVGLFAGTAASLLGVGGGIVFVPAVFYFYSLSAVEVDIAMKSAVATSLTMIFFTAIAGGLGHLRNGNYIPGALRWLIPGSVVGAAIGSRLALVSHGESLKFAYALLLFAVSAQMAFGRDRSEDCAAEGAAAPKTGIPAVSLLLVGLFSGVLSGFVGGGGGVIIVPALFLLTRYPIKKCVGESTLLIIFTSLAGASTFVFATPPTTQIPLNAGYVNIAICAAMVPAAILGARLGVTVSSRAKPMMLRRAFSVLCAFLGLEMIGAFTLLQNCFK